VPGEFIDAPVVVDASAIALPLCSSVVTVNVAAVHWAYSVSPPAGIVTDALNE
jgi:hypothetical protein